MRTLAFSLVVAMLAAGCAMPFRPLGDGGPGDAASDLISGAKYSKLIIEIDHPAGYAPNAEAMNVLRSTLREVTGKTSVDIVMDASIPAEPTKKYSYDEIARLEDAHRDHHTGGDTAVLYVVYVAGGSSKDTDQSVTLGAVYAGTSLVMFKGNIKANTKDGPLSTKPPENAVERAVIVHEFGHAAGLVNIGAKMVRPHEDAEHKGHSSNKASVMYWAVETSEGLALLCSIGLTECGIPSTYDADDKADLQALREA